jgi:glycosyltransferase involved in cell wall biosynthesis
VAASGAPVGAVPRRLVYVSSSVLPSAEANAVHVALMCQAFAAKDCDVTLRAARGHRGDVAAHYGLQRRFAIRFEGRLSHKAWMLSRRLAAGRSGDAPFYFGRRLIALSRLAHWGYPTALELHHPPRTPRQERALETFVAARGFRGLVVISERLRAEILRRLPRLDPRAVLVAPDGVDARRIQAPVVRRPAQDCRAVYCGSLHPGKGMETLLPAAALLGQLRFDVIGGDPQQIRALRERSPPNVHFLGWMPHEQTQQRLRDYDIALAPYSATVRGARTPAHESLASWMSPLKLFEYMAAGLPIVTSDLPVLRELLRDDDSALLVAPDDVQGYAAAIERLARDADLRERLARRAQETLRHHTWDNRAARILAFLADQCGGSQPALR